MRNLQYAVMVGNYRAAVVKTLAEAQSYRDKGYKVVEILTRAGKSPEEVKAEEECYRKIRERNPQNYDRRAIRFEVAAR